MELQTRSTTFWRTTGGGTLLGAFHLNYSSEQPLNPVFPGHDAEAQRCLAQILVPLKPDSTALSSNVKALPLLRSRNFQHPASSQYHSSPIPAQQPLLGLPTSTHAPLPFHTQSPLLCSLHSIKVLIKNTNPITSPLGLEPSHSFLLPWEQLPQP